VQLSDQLILAGVLQAILYLFFIRAIDLYEREPLPYVVAVFLWGFAVATTIAVFFNTLAKTTFASLVSEREANALTAIFVAPVVEESAKGLALLIIFVIAFLAALLRRGLIEFAGIMDGIVYGSAVGFGFALYEDISYGMQFGAETFIARRILGSFGHAAFTSSTGIGFGLIPFANSTRMKIVSPLLGLLVAIFLHSTFNFLATTLGPVAYLFMFIVVLVYLVLIIVWLNFERRSIKDELREEVKMGIISPEEYAILPTVFRRRSYYLQLVLKGQLREWSTARRVHSTAVDLAFAKSLARRKTTPTRVERVRALRQKILDLKAQAGTSTLAPNHAG
jgi:RsiW-degrading membrane proteinase PrsW (M82 family)